MKIFGWMQSKFNGGQAAIKKTNLPTTDHGPQESFKEEFSDWPNGLLAIGTFGNGVQKEYPEKIQNAEENASSAQDNTNQQARLTPEEVKLQREVDSLFCDYKIDSRELDTSLEESHKTRNYDSNAAFDDDDDDVDDLSDDYEKVAGHLNRSSSIILHGGNKDVCLDNPKKSIGKRSLSFLLEKMFVCRSGYSVTPRLRDSLPESRMKKIFRAMLHKKIYPQSSSTALHKNKYLGKSHEPYSGKYRDEMNDNASEAGSCKWVKTDSEYIVLEI